MIEKNDIASIGVSDPGEYKIEGKDYPKVTVTIS